jgi:error-prone DNA polymerase
MGSKRSAERMERLKARLFDGMAERGITGDVAEQIYEKLAAFANFGFPESHSVSFAYLVYSSAWIKLHEPAAFCAALLNAQPMGFYSPHSLVQDARRHGVVIRTPDINRSGAGATLEPCEDSEGGLAVRLGIGSVRTIGDDLAERIDAGRPYVDMEDVARRNALTLAQLEALATAGCFSSLGPVSAAAFRDTDARDSGTNALRSAMEDPGAGHGRREAIWAAGAVAQSRPDRLAGIVTGAEAPALPGMDDREASLADLWATGVSPEGHPTRFVRDELDRLGVITVAGLQAAEDGRTVLIGGVVTHRQRPATASGITFLNIEDETGLVNVVVSRGCWMRHRRVARTSPALLIRGKLEKVEGVINVVAERISLLPLPSRLRSRDFH